ncbi:MAG: hypothetical protein GYB25_08980 [Rhodobacteraceae bacterium]|nr:hypothetical protein [Paracoccaceae bacterium]
MNTAVRDLAVGPSKNRSIKASRRAENYRARETEGYFRTSTQGEAILRFIGIVILLGAFIQWLLPQNESAEMMMTKVGLAVAFSVIGLAVYTYSMRGSRYEIELDPIARTLSLSRLDRRDNVRSAKRFPLHDIKSIYVHKGDSIGAPSKMRIRLRNRDAEITALRGNYSDVELMHRALCRSIRILNS